MSELIQPNLIQPTGYEQARDILMDLHAVLRRYKAELFFRKEQRAMLLWVSDGSKEVYGGYKVVALLKKLTPLTGADYLKAVEPVLQPNLIRPENYAQVEDILKSMHEVLCKHGASLVFDVGKEGMHLLVDHYELAIVRNITRFGAELMSANCKTVRIAAPHSFEDEARLKAWLRGEVILPNE